MWRTWHVVHVTRPWVRWKRSGDYRASVVDTPPAEPLAGPGARERIAAAARDLFAANGYEHTTVDAIAERAGVARRTFFRYFRSKDEAILPDHERVLASIDAHLSATDDLPPLRALCSGARMVFRSYVEDPVVSLQRYQLTRSVPALRARENAIVSDYFRLFRDFLFRRLSTEPEQPGQPDASLRADVMAGAVVAAHNEVLRDWLRGGCQGDPMPSLDDAFAWVIRTFESPPPYESGTAVSATAQAQIGEDVVVAVFRTGESIDDVMQRISRRL